MLFESMYIMYSKDTITPCFMYCICPYSVWLCHEFEMFGFSLCSILNFQYITNALNFLCEYLFIALHTFFESIASIRRTRKEKKHCSYKRREDYVQYIVAYNKGLRRLSISFWKVFECRRDIYSNLTNIECYNLWIFKGTADLSRKWRNATLMQTSISSTWSSRLDKSNLNNKDPKRKKMKIYSNI